MALRDRLEIIERQHLAQAATRPGVRHGRGVRRAIDGGWRDGDA